MRPPNTAAPDNLADHRQNKIYEVFQLLSVCRLRTDVVFGGLAIALRFLGLYRERVGVYRTLILKFGIP